MTLIGVLWAMFAPLSLVAIILMLWLALRRAGVARAGALAAVLVVLPVAVVYAWDRIRFSEVCTKIGAPTITRRAAAEGIYLNSSTASSFGARYVLEEGFAWLERQDVYISSGYIRVLRENDAKLREEKILAPTALYEVIETLENRDGVNVSTTKVIDRGTGEEMARASDATFLGGNMAIFVGAWGSTSCLIASSDPARFSRYYHLARDTLRPDAAANTMR